IGRPLSKPLLSGNWSSEEDWITTASKLPLGGRTITLEANAAAGEDRAAPPPEMVTPPGGPDGPGAEAPLDDTPLDDTPLDDTAPDAPGARFAANRSAPPE